MEIVGYSDRLSAAPGNTIRFMVSCVHPSYRVDLIRLIHGDPHPRGPGIKERPVAAVPVTEHPGRVQRIHAGSHVVVADHPALQPRTGVTIQAWVWPTLPDRGAQGIVTKLSPADGGGYGLLVDERGGLAFWLGDGGSEMVRVGAGRPLYAGTWYFVAATCDAASGEIVLYQEPVMAWPIDESRAVVTATSAARGFGASNTDLLIAAAWQRGDDGHDRPGHLFNGKIDRPRLFSRALTREEIGALQAGTDPRTFGPDLIAAWDFAADVASTRVTDRGPHRLHGRTVNMPARGMTGANWRGDAWSFALAPEEYGAIHFHDDDLEDAGWAVDFHLTVPPDLPSGVYAARLRAGNAEERIPFVVHPPLGEARSPILVLVPTNSYLAYANFNVPPQSPRLFPNQDLSLHQTEHQYMTDNSLMSLYDKHRDGSGVCYSSRLRPILNMRPGFYFRDLGCAHNLPADLYLVDWLEAKGYEADFVTDEDLHAGGLDRLRPYRVVLTGTHPEYWTGPMLDALAAYLAGGGRLMYLGGNGFYWVTSFHPERPHVLEVRRWGGTEAWAAAPGEYHHSSTGELGGLWRNRGRAPQRLVGVGFTAQGFDRSSPYRRQPGSFDPRAAFIFDGIGDDELIGDFPALTMHYGAGGFELDRFDPALGSPRHALVLASSFGHSDSYQHVIEEVLMSDSAQGGSTNPHVRSDLVFFETPNGGAVFSVGSIAWCGALSANGYDNTVSRITDNVLRRFVAEEPLVT